MFRLHQTLWSRRMAGLMVRARRARNRAGGQAMRLGLMGEGQGQGGGMSRPRVGGAAVWMI